MSERYQQVDWKPTWKDRLRYWFVPFLVDWIMRILGWTIRKIEIGREHVEPYRERGESFIYSVWHESVLFSIHYHRRRRIFAMASASKDGEFIDRLLERTGNHAIRGSTSKFGRRALKEIISTAKKGSAVTFVPDGPRGPALKLQGGVVACAQLTGLPIIPIHYECEPAWRFEKAWDRVKIPKFFCTLVYGWGAPIQVPRRMSEAEFEAKRVEVERAMQALVQDCKTRLMEARSGKSASPKAQPVESR